MTEWYFFVVEIINSNTTRVFYNTLLPFDLEVILKQGKGQKSKALKFKTLNPSQFIRICESFLHNKNEQKGVPCIPGLDIKNFVDFQFSSAGSFKNKIKYLLNSDVYIKGLRTDTNQYVYFQKVQPESVEECNMSCITINGKQYYDSIVIQYFKNYNLVKIGKSTIIRFEKNKPVSINIKIRGNIYERISDLKFLIEWLEKLDLYVAKDKITICKNENIAKTLRAVLKNCNEIKFVLDYLNVELVDSMENFSADDNEIINILIKNIIYKQHAIKNDAELQLYNVVIHNKSFSILVTTNKENQEIINFFKMHERIQSNMIINNEPIQIPCYHECKAEDVVNQLNFDIKSIETTIIKCERSEVALEVSINLLLEMIKCYDIKNDLSYLEACERVSNYLMSNYKNSHYMVINHFQIIKRKRELTIEEKGILISMKDECKDDYKSLCGISAVLSNKADFDYYFSKLNEEQDLFKSWAIYKLVQNN